MKASRPRRHEAAGAFLALVPHRHNNNTRKSITMLLVAGWLVMTALIMTGTAVPTEGYAMLSAIVWAWYGKQQEQEAAGVTARSTQK